MGSADTTIRRVPTTIVSRSPLTASPIGRSKERSSVDSLPPADRTIISLPAWYVVTASVTPSCSIRAGKLAEWT